MSHVLLSTLVVSIGASLGALLRWQISNWLNPPTGWVYSFPNALPWGTLLVNVIGGLLIGMCVAVFQGLPDLNPAWRLALITGFLGALTTFSTFSVEVVTMLYTQQIGLALLTATAHLLGSLIATIVGISAVNAIGRLCT